VRQSRSSPTTADEQPPPDLGLIALTVAEIKRLFILVTRRLQPQAHPGLDLVATPPPSPSTLVSPPHPTPPTSSRDMT
jgi:hypothetical protein